MYYANYDNDGNIVGFYNPDIHKTIPSPSIPLTETQWQMCIDNPEEYKVDIGTLTLVAVEISLETLKTVKANEINAACQADIEGGFACGDYRYDSAQIDQSNLQLAVIGAISGT
ncbi:MAG TPA: hypothetical protein DEA44_09135, partial [Firmicutes bacterium]|nr:hypothetical protein [Bacillota bacterium]